MILSFLFFAFLGYLFYKLLVDFIIPIYKTTTQVKKTFREMHQKMNPQNKDANGQQKTTTASTLDKKAPIGDYIDFEEVKE